MDERVAEAAMVDDGRGAGAEFLAQTGYVDIYGTIGDIGVVLPDFIYYLFACEVFALMPDKQFEYAEFLSRQRDGIAIEGDGLATEIHLEGSVSEDFCFVCDALTAAFQHGIDACQHGGEREGLGDAVRNMMGVLSPAARSCWAIS